MITITMYDYDENPEGLNAYNWLLFGKRSAVNQDSDIACCSSTLPGIFLFRFEDKHGPDGPWVKLNADS